MGVATACAVRKTQIVYKLSVIFFLFYTYYSYIRILSALVGCTRDVLLLVTKLLDASISCWFLLQLLLGFLLHPVGSLFQGYAGSGLCDTWMGYFDCYCFDDVDDWILAVICFFISFC